MRPSHGGWQATVGLGPSQGRQMVFAGDRRWAGQEKDASDKFCKGRPERGKSLPWAATAEQSYSPCYGNPPSLNPETFADRSKRLHYEENVKNGGPKNQLPFGSEDPILQRHLSWDFHKAPYQGQRQPAWYGSGKSLGNTREGTVWQAAAGDNGRLGISLPSFGDSVGCKARQAGVERIVVDLL